IHVYYRRGALPAGLQSRVPSLSRAAGIVGIAALLAQATAGVLHPSVMDEHRALYWIGSVPVLSVGYGGLAPRTMFGFPSWKRLFRFRPLCFVGLISYSVYIWNIPVFRYLVLPFARWVGSDVATVLLGIGSIFVVIMPLCYLSYRFIE